MAHLGSTSLESLARGRAREVEGMLAGIQGKPGSVLWTSELRPSTRGGMKCSVTPTIDENSVVTEKHLS